MTSPATVVVILPLRVYRLHDDAILPLRYGESVGWDLSAYLISESGRANQALIPPRTTRVIGTGLVVLPPDGHYLSICSRNGASAQQPPVFVTNAPIVNPNYDGELTVILYNGGHESTLIRHEERIAQLVVLPLRYCNVVEIPMLPKPARGD